MPCSSQIGFAILATVMACVGCAPAHHAAVMNVLRTQQDAWNRGDIDGFMQHYWKSDKLTFSAGGETHRGWQATYDRYRQRYPTAGRMGKLTFSDLEVLPLGRRAALVLGRWRLEREGDPAGGNFSVVFRRFGGRWIIVHDHTSQSPPTPAPTGESTASRPSNGGGQ